MSSVCSACERRVCCMEEEIYFKPYVTGDKRMWKYSFFQGKVIVIEGNIGAGKSSLAKQMALFFNEIGISAVYLPEYVDIELLTMFIKDMKTYAYPFQLFMLEKRAEIYRKAMDLANLGNVVIMDRMLYGDYVFALHHFQNGNISDSQFASYQKRMQKLQLHEPALTFYLDTSPTCAFERASQRNRSGETYKLSYFEEIDACYQKVFSQFGGDIIYVPYEKHLSENELPEKVQEILKMGIDYLLL